MKTAVIGLGNPILTDDGIGIYAARAVQAALPPASAVTVLELAVGGLRLMEAMIGFERVILLDALWAPERPPGTVAEFSAVALRPTLHTASAHDVDLPAALRAGRMLGAVLPPDDQITVVAVCARQVQDFGERPIPAVQAALPEVVTRVLRLLDRPAVRADEVVIEGGFDGIA